MNRKAVDHTSSAASFGVRDLGIVPPTSRTSPRISTGGHHQQHHSSYAGAEESYVDETDASYGGQAAAPIDPIDLKHKFDSFLPAYELCMGQGAKFRQFVHSMTLLPNAVVVAANRSLLNSANDLTVLDASGKTERRFEFYYVTAGPIDEGYYLTTLLFRHFLFDGEPIVPVAFLIHERKNVDDHRRLFELVQEKCPDVAASECVFITDREFRDIRSILPQAVQLYSWHYFEDDVVNWVENNGGTNDDANTYLNDIYTLMKCKALEQFNHALAAKRRQWPPDFASYFDSSLKTDIVAKGGRWHSEPLRGGVYNDACGVVIPSCSDLNQLVYDLVEWQDVSLDQILQCIYHFSEYYVRETDKAMHQSLGGNFKLQHRYVHYARPSRRPRQNQYEAGGAEVNHPRDIINYVRTTSSVATGRSGGITGGASSSGAH